MKIRQVMIASAVFNSNGWLDWKSGRAKLFGVFVWCYLNKNKSLLKYSKTLKKMGYRRTHNYSLLNEIVRHNLIKKMGKGYYKIPDKNIRLISRAIAIVKLLAQLKDPEEENNQEEGWQNIV